MSKTREFYADTASMALGGSKWMTTISWIFIWFSAFLAVAIILGGVFFGVLGLAVPLLLGLPFPILLVGLVMLWFSKRMVRNTQLMSCAAAEHAELMEYQLKKAREENGNVQ